MDSRHYAEELKKFPATYASALDADVSGLVRAIAGASRSSLVAVGSGGSFTVASLLCNLHEAYTGQVSRPSTPLEIICNPTLAANSPGIFVSAEGKNPDITEALRRARTHSSRPLHILTNRADSPLIALAGTLRDVTSHNFELKYKDGYLATNSLLLDATLVARTYEELAQTDFRLPSSYVDLRLGPQTVADWVSKADAFASEVVHAKALIVVYAPALRAIAADIESKLAEAALVYCQVADLRSFAHGRHLWLSERAQDTTILALTDENTGRLWDLTRSLIPSGIPLMQMHLSQSAPAQLIAALVAEMHFVDLLASRLAKDPGKPTVESFGRELYYSDVGALVPSPALLSDGGVQNKLAAIGARWPYVATRGAVQRVRDDYLEAISSQQFSAVVFDYDGTLCASGSEVPPTKEVAEQLLRLLDGGVIIGVVSGRGQSMRNDLQAVIPEHHWPRVSLGLYNGGLQLTLGANDFPSEVTSEFLQHVERIARVLKKSGMPIDKISARPPYQVGIRFMSGVDTEDAWYVIADSLRQAGLAIAGIVRSRHSIDILGPGVTKARTVAHLVQKNGVLPLEVLTVGDQGAWPGNDAALLDHRFSLSVDNPCRRLDRGWKIAPVHTRGVDAALWYLERMRLRDGKFQIDLRGVLGE